MIVYAVPKQKIHYILYLSMYSWISTLLKKMYSWISTLEFLFEISKFSDQKKMLCKNCTLKPCLLFLCTLIKDVLKRRKTTLQSGA